MIYSDHFNDQKKYNIQFHYSPSAGTSTSFSSSSLLSEPSWCIDIKISVPPTNSLLIYSWGMVCQSLYSLIPIVFQSASTSRQIGMQRASCFAESHSIALL
jgi:hypothetical protein